MTKYILIPNVYAGQLTNINIGMIPGIVGILWVHVQTMRSSINLDPI